MRTRDTFIKGFELRPKIPFFWRHACVGICYDDAFERDISERVGKLLNQSPTPVRWLVIDCGAITDIDFSAGRAVMGLHQDLADTDVVLALFRLQVKPEDDLEQMGLVKLIGANPIFDSRHDCIKAYRSQLQS